VIDVKLERPRDETAGAFADHKRAILAEIRDDMRRAARSG
jgi:hypothetical protein